MNATLRVESGRGVHLLMHRIEHRVHNLLGCVCVPRQINPLGIIPSLDDEDRGVLNTYDAERGLLRLDRHLVLVLLILLGLYLLHTAHFVII